MKKILVFLVMMSVLIGILVFNGMGVIAVDQGINATIGENITILITPTTVEFGGVLPGTNNNAATSGSLTFNPGGSNVDVNVDVTIVAGEPFKSGLKFDGTLAEGQDYDIPCVLVASVCTYTPKIVNPTLNVPIGSPAGLQAGIITYTVTGTTP